MLRIFIVFWICVLMGCDSSKAGSGEKISVKFDDTTLEIPRVYLLPNLPASITGEGGELDEGEGVSLKIPLPDIDYAVVSDGGLIGGVVVFLSPLSSRTLETTVSNDVLEAWKGEGLYSNRIVERDEVVSLYRVYPKAGYPKLWNYFKVEPNGGDLDVKNWVAGCRVGPLEKEAADLSNVKCKSVGFYKDIQAEISYSGVHLLSLDKLLDKINAEIKQWDVTQSI